MDNRGHTFTKKRESKLTTFWSCSVRNKNQRCPATISQRGDTFVPGKIAHCHPSQPGVALRAKMAMDLKKQATERVNSFKSSGKMVETALNAAKDDNPNAILPDPSLLQRRANRARQSTRPNHPTSLDFDLDEGYLPEDFLRADINGAARHLVFATDDQLKWLSRAEHWYIDGTFKVMREPFVQLFSLHAFVRRDACEKQVPLAFIVMSRRTAPDYTAALQAVIDALPSPPSVKTITTDFEKGIWRGCREVLPEVKMRGCGFHWAQAVERYFGEVGLLTFYKDKAGPLRDLLRKLLALPYLPPSEIPAAFNRLEDVALDHGDARLVDLFEYVRTTWLESSVWSVEDWSVYNRRVRTNNDTEGWHRRLNSRANENVPLYLLIDLLYEEARLVRHQVQLVQEQRLRRSQKSTYTELQQKTMTAWEEYERGHLSADQLLRRISLWCRS